MTDADVSAFAFNVVTAIKAGVAAALVQEALYYWCCPKRATREAKVELDDEYGHHPDHDWIAERGVAVRKWLYLIIAVSCIYFNIG